MNLVPVHPFKYILRSAYNTELVLEMPVQATDLRGIAIPRMTTHTAQAPGQDGATVIEQVLDSRTFLITTHIAEAWGAKLPFSAQGSRQRLLQIINPGLGDLEFDVLFTNGDKYTLKGVRYESGFEVGNSTRGQATKHRMSIRLRAHNPAWWGDEHTWTIDANTSNNAALPAWSYVRAAENYGSWFSNPKIELTGPMYNPKVYLATWDADLADYSSVAIIEMAESIAAAAKVTITTAFGERQAVDESGDNVDLDDSTVFSLFSLAYHPLRALHDLQTDANWYNNFIAILCSSGCTAASTMTVTYADRFLGI